jgi:hypothetical protein
MLAGVPTILITGAAGQIGTMLRPRLARPGRILRLLDITDLTAGPAEEVVRASITDMDAMTAASRGASAMIHLAGIATEASWEEILQLNIQGTYVAFEAARRAGVPRVIFASSNHAVGFSPRESFPVPDYAFPAPDTYYGVAKVAGEALAGLYHDRYGLDTICIRILTCSDKPPSVRALSTWLSPDDAGRLFEACLTVPDPGFQVVFGVSANTAAAGSACGGERWGVGRDDAESLADEVIAGSASDPADPAFRYRRRVHLPDLDAKIPWPEGRRAEPGRTCPWDVRRPGGGGDRRPEPDQVTLAAAYLRRAVAPFHPRHRIVPGMPRSTTAPTGPTGRPPVRPARLRPAVARHCGSFERAAVALRSRGLQVTAWAVITHNDRLGAVVTSAAVRNAFGDGYPWALCLASPAVRDYATTLAGEIAALPEASAVELEACGWYGVEHLSAHDKTAGAAAGPAAQWLLSVCFCLACRGEYAAAGADPAWLAACVRAAVDAPPGATRPS